MLIAARNSFVVGGKRLPYDAEVEYLESTGTQWIDTGVEFADNVGYMIDAQFTVNTSEEYPVVIGSQLADESEYKMVYEDSSLVFCETYGRYVASKDAIIRTGRFIAKFNHLGDAKINVWLYGEQEQPVTPYPIEAFFSMSILNIGLFCSIDEYGNGNFMSKARVYGCEITSGNSVVRDIIPVRVGNVGSIYDRRGVGGMNADGSARDDGLYFNRGTGSFIIGPDASAPHRGGGGGGGGGYKRKCVRRSHRRSLRPSARFCAPHLWKEVA